jgi:hypothetical protein
VKNFIIPVEQMEFHEGQQTIWIHAPNGTTALRIKCTGKITVDKECTSPVVHGDIMVQGDINICIPSTE